MPFSDGYANSILNWAFGKGLLPKISRVYIGLCANNPETNGSFSELSGSGYQRVLISLAGGEEPNDGEIYMNSITGAKDREITNFAQINWNKATGNWTTAHGFGLFTSKSGGDPFFYGALEEPVTCVDGAVMLFDPQALKISFPKTDV